VTVTASLSPRVTDAVMNNSARSASLKPSGTAAAGTTTSASRPERMTLSRRSGSIASMTFSRNSRSFSQRAPSAVTPGTCGHSSRWTLPPSG